mmetsp:Transcript_4149/g.8147  ORF Transcript_4149/g.8147 Transcript_4149/m.8147 type:complete len:176 (-) Transcript_4149:1156-1683(-)
MRTQTCSEPTAVLYAAPFLVAAYCTHLSMYGCCSSFSTVLKCFASVRLGANRCTCTNKRRQAVDFAYLTCMTREHAVRRSCLDSIVCFAALKSQLFRWRGQALPSNKVASLSAQGVKTAVALLCSITRHAMQTFNAHGSTLPSGLASLLAVAWPAQVGAVRAEEDASRLAVESGG